MQVPHAPPLPVIFDTLIIRMRSGILIIIATGGGDFTGQPPASRDCSRKRSLSRLFSGCSCTTSIPNSLSCGTPSDCSPAGPSICSATSLKARHVSLFIKPDHPRIELFQLVLEGLAAAWLRRCRRNGVLKRFHAGLHALMGLSCAYGGLFSLYVFSNIRASFPGNSRRQTRLSGIRLAMLQCVVKSSKKCSHAQAEAQTARGVFRRDSAFMYVFR